MDISLITKWEGFRPKAYTCPAGKLTIGYGSTYLYSRNRFVQKGDVIEKADAVMEIETYLRAKVFPKLTQLASSVGSIPDPLSNSLCSIAYNVGPLCLDSPTLKEALSKKDEEAMENWFLSYVHIGKKVNEGLLNRRKDEVANFKWKIWL